MLGFDLFRWQICSTSVNVCQGKRHTENSDDRLSWWDACDHVNDGYLYVHLVFS